MTVKETSGHELYHAIANGIAACDQGISPSDYDNIILHISATNREGECAIEVPDSIGKDTHLNIARLAAFGPVAAAEDVISLIRKGDTDALIRAGNA